MSRRVLGKKTREGVSPVAANGQSQLNQRALCVTKSVGRSGEVVRGSSSSFKAKFVGRGWSTYVSKKMQVQRRCSSAVNQEKQLWLSTVDADCARASLEAGVRTFVFEESVSGAHKSEVREALLEVISACEHDSELIIVQDGIMRKQNYASDSRGAVIGGWKTCDGANDVSRAFNELDSSAIAEGMSRGRHIIVLDCIAETWKIIPAENAIAAFQENMRLPVKDGKEGIDRCNEHDEIPKLSLFATAGSCEEAQILFEALEVGVHGVVLRTDIAEEVQNLLEWLSLKKSGNSAQNVNSLSTTERKGSIQISKGKVINIVPVGMGDRVCIDCISLIEPGFGMLIGSFAQGLMLVHSECLESSYIASRPFRVNAGAVHSYVQVDNTRTKYLSELKSGDEVLLLNNRGETKTAIIGYVNFVRTI